MTASLQALAIAFACPVCFRVEDDATAAGVRAAVLVLMTVTVLVLAGFAAFILRWRRGTYLFSTDLARSRPVPDRAESVENRYVPLEP